MHRRLIGSDGPERLGRIEFFDGLSEGHRRMLARHIDEVSADPGDVLMQEGDYGYEVMFVEEGSAEVRSRGELINSVGPGEIVGELALVDADGLRTASVTAASPLRSLSLTSRSFHEIRERIPELAQAIDRAAEEHHERDRRRSEGAGTV